MEKQKKQNQFGLAPILLGLLFIAGAILFVCWSFIDSLQENSAKMRMYKVKPKVKEEHQMALFSDNMVDEYDMKKLHPKVESLFQEGCRYRDTKQYRPALKKFLESLKTYETESPTAAKAYLTAIHVRARLENITACYIQLGEYANALKYANLMVARSSDSPTPYETRARVYEKLNKKDLEKKDRDKARYLRSHPLRENDILKDIVR